MLIAVNLSSCSGDEDPIEVDNEATLSLAVKSEDTLWNQVSLDYTVEATNFEPVINLLVDGEFISAHENGDPITLNTKNFTDGTHDITLDVLDGETSVKSTSVEVNFLNTLAVVDYGEYLNENTTGYILVDFNGETIAYEEITNNATITISRPDDFNEDYFNVNYITFTPWYYSIRAIKNVHYLEEEYGNYVSSNGTEYDFQIINLPTEYDYYNVAGPYGMGAGPIEYAGISLESEYTQYATTSNEDFYLYVREPDKNSYLYIEDLNTMGNNAVYDFAEASTEMDSYSLNFANPLVSLGVGMAGPSDKYKTVYLKLTGLDPVTSLTFSLPRLEDFEKYNSYNINQTLRINDKYLSINDENDQFRIKEPIDLDFTYTSPALGQMDLDITGDYDEVRYNVEYQKSDFTSLSWRVSYKNYNGDHTFPSIPEEIIPDFENFISEFNYDFTVVRVSKTDEEGTKYQLYN
ncbi:hypothetical protein RM549_05165 [Salegentibacter sp. F188]|uniref:Uncharacterized protein n=1 Tax=Autumnicola patrickiae TaxID=3075591 RepID=A0ABU3DZM3_9FLAO|nr:hypothetical protein [Salegentibacter sp. F188]MDT0689163.1 hypothetical protein [Salegentibacter sp. F188]